MRLVRVVSAIPVLAALSWGCTQDTAGPRGLAASFVPQSDFIYPVNPPRVEVSPGTVVPDGVPYCRSGMKLVLTCYSPQFVKTAYNFPSTLDGTGQTILIVDAFGSPTIQQDLAKFDQTFGIQAGPSFTFTILCPEEGCPVFDPSDTHHDEIGWSIETSLDVEYAHAMAPGANIVLVVASTSSGNAINSAEAAAIKRYPGSIMSQSFGIPEIVVHNNNAQIMQAHKNYEAAKAAGITVLASAGDFGATNGFGVTNALFPASDPMVTAVGGTQGLPYVLSFGTPPAPLSCAAGATCSTGLATFTGPCSSITAALVMPCTPAGYGGEQVWNEARFGAATGGAPSLLFATPSYQSGLNLATRTTPDVSYNAAINGGVLVYWSALGVTVRFIVGGTSAGSPQWASIVALANQLNGSSLGFINPALYGIGSGANYTRDFHDIMVGKNALAGRLGFPATTGWDDASGFGTPNVSCLVADLAKKTVPTCR
jgi:subtilase family serine protease